MRRIMRAAMAVIAFMVILGGYNAKEVQAKSVKTLKVVTGSYRYLYKNVFNKAKSVKVRTGKSGAVKVKYQKKHKRIKISGKKTGTVSLRVTVKGQGKKTKKYSYKVKSYRRVKLSEREKAKKSIKLINEYRNESGVAALEWSDDLYECGLYRLKTSGFDGHKNSERDLAAFFQGFYYKTIQDGIHEFNENLAKNCAGYDGAVKAWRKSPGHYGTMIDGDYKSVAVARVGLNYITIFSTYSQSELAKWKDYDSENEYISVNVREKDSATGGYVSGATISYYDEADRWSSRGTARIRKASGIDINLIIGHTYVIYDSRIADEDGKVKRVTITAAKDGTKEIELIS